MDRQRLSSCSSSIGASLTLWSITTVARAVLKFMAHALLTASLRRMKHVKMKRTRPTT